MVIGSTRPMEDAARIAYRELVRWLEEDYGFDVYEAYFLLTQAGRVRLGNMVDPKYTLGASILKRYLPTQDYGSNYIWAWENNKIMREAGYGAGAVRFLQSAIFQ